MAPPRHLDEPLAYTKRARDSPSENDHGSFSKKPRTAPGAVSPSTDNMTQTTVKENKRPLTPVINPTNVVASPVTRQQEGPTGTPPAGPGLPPPKHRAPEDIMPQSQTYSQDTQVMTQPTESKNPMFKSVDDENKEGVWGYLLQHGRTIVLRKRKDDCSRSTKSAASGGYLIGRHPECDIRIDINTISNRHCLIFSEHQGNDIRAVVEDLSCNGTYVNEAIVGRNKRRDLEDGDQIDLLGKATFTFKYPRSRESSTFHQQYDCLQQLGHGHFARVHLCVEKATGQLFAVKIFSKTSAYESMLQEIALLKSVNHVNVLCLKDAFREPDGVYLILELAPQGELFNYIVEKSRLSERETRRLFSQIFEGVKYLHYRDIVHRDIKPENILLADKTHVKIADFGLAKIIGEDSFATTLCGTPAYVAPEILNDESRRKYDKAVDIWALGVVLYICLCGYPPFSDELYCPRRFPYRMIDQIRGGRFEFADQYWGHISDSALDLIENMLVVNSADRFTIDQCLNHSWMKSHATNFNDSTSSLVNRITELSVSRRGVGRERTILSRLATVRVKETLPSKDDSPPVTIYERTRIEPAPREARPDDNRNVDEFIEMGGKGDVQLFDDDVDPNDSLITHADASTPCAHK